MSDRLHAKWRFNPAWLIWLAVPLLLGWALREVRLGDVIAALGHLSLSQIAILFIINIFVMLTFSGRWWLTLRALGYPIPYLTLARYRLAAFSVSYFTPGPHLGGEPLQVYLARARHAVPLATATASVALDKLIELIVNFSFLAAGAALTLQARGLGGSVGPGLALAAMGLLALPLVYLLALRRRRQPMAWLAGQIAQRWDSPRAQPIYRAVESAEGQASAFTRQHPAALAGALGVSLVSWGALLAEYWLAYHYLGLTLAPLDLIGLMTAARLAILLPLPGGLGSYEAGQVWMLSVLGFDPAIGLSLSLLIHARDLAFGGLGIGLGLADFKGTSLPVVRSPMGRRRLQTTDYTDYTD